MHAVLRPSWSPQRVAGAAATLMAIGLLAFVIVRPIPQPPAEPSPETVTFVPVEPVVAPDILPVTPLEKIDLPLPMATVNLPEFAEPVVSLALPSFAPVTSTDASPRPSGNEARIGAPEGTGRTNGAGSALIPPVRRVTADAPFDLKSASRAGRVTSLNFCVTDAGLVRHVQLAASSGFGDLDGIATEWLGKQRFTPGTLDGVPVRMCATYDIRWMYSKATPFEAQTAAKAHATAIRRRSKFPRQFVYWPEDRAFPGCDAITSCRKTVE